MPSVQHLKEFIRERLTAAGEEIFSEFEKTIVQFVEELSQRRLADISRTPEIKLHSTDLQEQHGREEEEALDDQQVCNQERNSSVDQEDTEPPQPEEEQEEIWTGEQLVLKQDTEDIVVWAGEELDIMWKPETKLNRMDIPQQHDCKDEVGLDDQQICNQDRNSNLDQEDPEPPQPKEEQEELWTSQEREQLVLKQETKGTIIWTGEELGIMWKPVIKLKRIVFPLPDCKEELVLTDQHVCYKERNSSLDHEYPELPHIKGEQEEFFTSQKGEQVIQKPEIDTFPAHEEGDHSEPEPNIDQLLSHNSPLPDQEEGEDDNSPKNKSEQIITSLRGHTSKKPYFCGTCGKTLIRLASLKVHMRIHTGEKPYCCSTCGNTFRQLIHLKRHMRKHTGEKPYCCNTCGKRLRHSTGLKRHMRIHTGEKPYCCSTCGKTFNQMTTLKVHMRIHTGEKPYCCSTCGKTFIQMAALKVHENLHR
ncbi:zinc finger protein 568-like isoform X2 [Archocentrus centrarchus]|uniref:zinc finger protein 568-like isoform X2 n=1 Tax=Archocentrus centrarchus TaxID=63155 RepID=UPI0011E9E49A|nr:zinc finger protein 568-like isoform X2 [Archocentrus centrarchus]